MLDKKPKGDKVSILKEKELKSIIIKFRSDGILQFDLKQCDEFTVNDLKETNEAVKEFEEGKSFPRLTVVNHFIQFGKDVRLYSATEESNHSTIAAAFVVKLIALKFVGNFYVSYNKPARPTRIFTSEEEAVAWLKTFM